MLNILIIVLYLIVILAVGAYFARRTRGLVDFFVAGRKVGTWACTATLCATIVGGSVTIGMAGIGFEMGLTGAWWLFVGSVGLIILAATFGGKVRKLAVYTLPELVGRLYDKRMRLAASILIVMAWVGVIAGQILAAGLILSTLLGWPMIISTTASTSVFIAYTFLGGQRAVVRTDLIQLALILVGVCLLAAPLALVRVGGLAGLGASLPSGHFSFPTSSGMSGFGVISLFLLVGMTYVVGPDIYSRLFSAKDESTAKKSAVLASLCLIPVALLIVLIGMSARVMFPEISPEQAIPTIIREVLPIGLSGITLAAFLAALMSSADTLLMTTSTISAWDIYKQHINPRASDGEVLRVSRVTMIAIGLLALAIALWVGEVISALIFAYTIFSSGLIIPIIAGFYRKKIGVNSNGALAGLIGGGGAALAWRIFEVPTPEPVIIGMLVCLTLLIIVSKLMPENHR